MWRIRLALTIFFLAFLTIIFRLFYWQVLASDRLAIAGYNQYTKRVDLPAWRGEIKTNDGFVLATNETAYTLSLVKKELKDKPEILAAKLAPLFTSPQPDALATLSGLLKQPSPEEVKEAIIKKLSNSEALWIPLFRKVDKTIKDKIEQDKIPGVYFEAEQKRFYPEASLSAQILGFLGQNYNGEDRGYFGLEGFYDRELRGNNGAISEEKDVYGRPILIGDKTIKRPENGRSLILNIDRTVQYIVEERLKQGIEKYGAKAGSVVVMDPKTGGILAMASFPKYDVSEWFKFDSKLYKNPVVADSYEPGSTFKVLVMAAALNEGVVDPDTKCDQCTGPREIGGYTIRTWNNKYFPNTTMTEVLEHSDNTGMVFTMQRLKKDKFLDYLRKFGLGTPTGIDLEEETSPYFRPNQDWREIDLATTAFGQGIALTAMQMLRAVGAIANGGNLMEPHVVKTVVTPEGTKIDILPKLIRNVVMSKTTKVLTEMMIQAVDRGEAKWAKPQGYRIAGKTGTAQIPVAGHYDDRRTIASFVGFAPADNPKFVMLVRLSEPTTSPWGSETAAPLFFNIAKELFSYYGIGPQ
ncbi:penicillin-binding protein 2 [Candidatus Gottesmanbacteria bacterium]|nr:penicillin-binding protein 2 [Candidatus Gottesmanbacteria bacterium]